MQSISIFSKIIRFFVAFVVAVSLFCFESHADDCVLGTDGCATEFTVTTTELSAGTMFSFTISAAGTYYIDWGDDGAIEPIVKGTVGEQTITHIYTNAGQYTIGMSGQATLYIAGNATAAISFKENKNISGISGSLGAIFGTLTDRVNSDGTLMSDAQPRFYQTFLGCSNLSGNIPENLFAGISGAPADYMFAYTFQNCSGLSGSIPENLFAGINGAPQHAMFYRTFEGCSGLSGSIPEDLFAGIKGKPASEMFSATFVGCSKLSGNIPENLFAGISGAPASNMFSSTFYGCRGLSGSIPENLFAGISGAPADSMFYRTFYGCSNLSGSISENLFAGIKGAPADRMFFGTFYGCRGLSGYVPANLFAGIDKTTTASNQMDSVFNATGLATSCPASTYQYLTGFESDFQGKVACSACPADYPNADSGATSENECYRKCTTDDVAGAHSVMGNNYYGTGVDTCQEAVYYISAGEYLPAGGEEPVDCPSGYYCPGVGDVRWDEKNDQGLVLCPTDFPNSDTGAKTESDCYKPCTTDDVVGAMTVIGTVYYGDGLNTCAVTECMAGWFVKPGLNLAETIGEDEGSDSAYISDTGSFRETNYDGNGAKGQEYYGISGPMSFAVNYAGKGMLTGHGRCSTQAGVGLWNSASTPEDVTVINNLTDETGQSDAQYCYCQVDGFTPTGGDKVMVTSAPWVFNDVFGSADNCADGCASYCAYNLRPGGVRSLAFRAAVMDATGNIGPGICEEITYTLNPGEYLPAGGEEPVDCPNGSYCPGAGDVKYDEEKDQGLVACPDGYDNSDSGAKSENDCYKPCTTDDVAGAMTVSGQIYYGSNGNSCIATSCVAGWGVKNFINQIGTEYGLNSAYISTNSQSYGRFYEESFDGDGPKGQAYYGITDLGTFAVDYGENGVITGRGRCSTKPGVFDYDYDTEVLKELTVWDELDDETGQSGANYCYCQVDGYTPVGELTQVLSDMPWVFKEESWSESGCSEYCAQSCAGGLRANDTYWQKFRSAVFGEPNVCVQESYRMNAGIYLPAGASDAVICPSGSYCPGADSVTKNSNKNQGISECPTEYPYSDAGAVSASNCYKPCTTDDVVNSVSVTGKNYYGDGYDTCAATQCLADWKLQDLYGIVGDTEGLNSAYISTNSSSYGEFRDSAGLDQDYYGISEIGSFAVDYGDTGIITGRARCSTKSGTNNGGTWTNPTRFKELDDESGVVGARYCYCQVDSYTPVGGLTQVLYDMPWVFKEESWSESGCSEYCAQSCAGGLKSAYTESLAFRSAVFGYASCDEEVYRVNPGDYLPEGEESPSECPSGSFCSGTIGVSSKPDKSQGVSECPSEYPYSDAGAKSESQCYRDCTGDDVANAMTAVGRNYYGDGVDTCIATDCVSGWHLKPGINLEELVGSTYEGSNSEYMAGTNSAYINNAGEFIEYDMYDENHSQDYYGISEKNSFAVGYGEKGIITGRARCSEMSDEKLDEITDEFGAEGVENCYCRVDAYVGVDGIKQNISAPWLYLEWLGWDGPETCTDYCVEYCASNMREHMTLDFRGKMFEAAYELPVCSVNQININWNLGYGDNNVSTTTCSYTDVIEYPTDPVRPGYTFTGWKLVE